VASALLPVMIYSSAVGLAAAVTAVVAVVLGYPVLMETLVGGRTVGKMALGLRVVTAEGGAVRFQHSAVRALLGIVEVWMTLGGVASAAVLISARHQRVGDLAAGTIVVRERQASIPSFAVSFVPPPGLEDYTRHLDTSALTPPQYAAIRAFLLRAKDLAVDARWALAERIAEAVREHLGHQPPVGFGPEAYLDCVAANYQIRQGAPMAVGAWLPGSAGWKPPTALPQTVAVGASPSPPPPSGYPPPPPSAPAPAPPPPSAYPPPPPPPPGFGASHNPYP